MAARSGGRWCAAVVWSLGLALAGFQLYTAAHGVLSPLLQRSLHLFGLTLLSLWLGGDSRREISACPSWREVPWIALAAGLGCFFLLSISPEQVLERGIAGPTTIEIWAGAALLVLILEATRRAVGLPIALVALAFILYGYLGPYLPWFLAHKGYDTGRLVSYLVWSTEGVFGIPLMVSASFVAVFILFGSLLNSLGAGRLFSDLALALTGRHTAGPAQAAVLGSALMGSISGSSVSNVVTTGTFTIPLMRRTGLEARFAGAVEAVASTGGQLMPPVMGAAAFVMAELLGVSYARVALAAALPALLYFLSLGLMLHFRARRLGLKPARLDELPRARKVLARGWHLLIPLAVLVHLLVVEQLSPMRAGFFSILALVFTASAAELLRGRPLPWRQVLEGLVAGMRVAAPVALACAAAGVVIGVVSLTGLGVRFTQLVVQLSGGVLWLAALLTMLACLVLGMGLPTTAAYIITAVLGAPALIKLGVAPLAAHMFILYFAIISFITPPVAISAYAAAGISGASPLGTGLTAFRLGLAGFLVPFLFIYSPELLLLGGWGGLPLRLAGALLGVTALAAGLEGWLGRRLGWGGRLCLLLAAVALVWPGVWARLCGGLTILLIWKAPLLRTRHPARQTP